MGLVFRLHGLERVEQPLVLTGGQQAAFDTELADGIGEAETVHEHADRSHHARAVGVDLVGRHHRVVTAGGTDVLDHRVDRNLRILLAQAPDLVVDEGRLHRRTAGRIGADDDTDRTLVLEGGAQAGDDVVGAGGTVGFDGAFQFDQRGIPGHQRARWPVRQGDDQSDQDHVRHKQQFKEDSPATFQSLFVQAGKGEPLENARPDRRCG